MPREATHLRTGLSQYWAARLFNRKVTHLDIFLYEIPAEYSRKYTHLILVEHREGGVKLLRTDAYACVAHSFVPPIPVKDVMQSFIDRVDVSEPIRINGRLALERARGYDLARWFKAYHHQYFRGLVQKTAKLNKITTGKTASIRFHYFATYDLDPNHKFANHWWRIGKGQGRGRVNPA